MKTILISFAGLVIVTVAILGFRGQTSHRPPLWIFPDMQDQPKYKPQTPSAFFADGRADRPTPHGTVPWGRKASQPDDEFLISDQQRFAMKTIPLKLDRQLLQRGQRLYGIYCAVCHGGTGSGDGITTHSLYGMNKPPSYHQDRLRQATDGYIYQVITEGKNTMGGYGGNIHPSDRWAIVAYVRALQRANNASIQDVPADRLQELKP